MVAHLDAERPKLEAEMMKVAVDVDHEFDVILNLYRNLSARVAEGGLEPGVEAAMRERIAKLNARLDSIRDEEVPVPPLVAGLS